MARISELLSLLKLLGERVKLSVWSQKAISTPAAVIRDLVGLVLRGHFQFCNPTSLCLLPYLTQASHPQVLEPTMAFFLVQFKCFLPPKDVLLFHFSMLSLMKLLPTMPP